jgi:hypothetical protein
MALLIHDGIAPIVLQSIFDPDAVKIFTFALRPEVWAQETVYYANKSIVLPSEFNGFYYLAISGGKSGTTEPAWTCAEEGVTEDECVSWQAKPYNFYLTPDINIVDATWEANNTDIIITDITNDTDKTSAKVSNVPADLTFFKVTIHFTFDNGEEDDRSFIVPVGEL